MSYNYISSLHNHSQELDAEGRGGGSRSVAVFVDETAKVR